MLCLKAHDRDRILRIRGRRDGRRREARHDRARQQTLRVTRNRTRFELRHHSACDFLLAQCGCSRSRLASLVSRPPGELGRNGQARGHHAIDGHGARDPCDDTSMSGLDPLGRASLTSSSKSPRALMRHVDRHPPRHGHRVRHCRRRRLVDNRRVALDAPPARLLGLDDPRTHRCRAAWIPRGWCVTHDQDAAEIRTLSIRSGREALRSCLDDGTSESLR